MAKLIRPPGQADVTAFMRMLFLRTERELVNEITRKRGRGLIEYAEAASLERVQRILQNMVDESWSYVPSMLETIFYRSDKHAAGYRNARVLTATQTAVIQQLGNNLLGELTEASETAYKTVERLYTIGRLENDPFREMALRQVLAQEASGKGWSVTSERLAWEMENKGVTAFVDKAGRQWSLQSYGNMAVRTTARQAEVAAVLTADDYDLWQIVKIGSTCPVCAPLEGRVYSKSGTSPDYPPLSLAFGKVDPFGPEALTNTYLNIHPNCLHALVKYTTIGKSEKQIQRDKEFSNPVTNPITRDPRTKKQIEAYREKERARQKLLRDKRKTRYAKASYEGIPKTWGKLSDGADIMAVNPMGNRENCVNCTIAYEMRRRGFAVVAGNPIKKLQNNPFSGWVSPDIKIIEAGSEVLSEIEKDMILWGEGSRAQISIIWNRRKEWSGVWGLTERPQGHSFVAEYRDKTVVFIDAQTGSKYNKNILEKFSDNPVKYCRIDNLEINDLGSTACKKEQ